MLLQLKSEMMAILRQAGLAGAIEISSGRAPCRNTGPGRGQQGSPGEIKRRHPFFLMPTECRYKKQIIWITKIKFLYRPGAKQVKCKSAGGKPQKIHLDIFCGPASQTRVPTLITNQTIHT
jgi:hypothetical protein